MNWLKKAYSKIILYKQKIKWDRDTRFFEQHPHEGYQLNADQSFLIIAPHADDELIGCHAFMKHHNASVCLCSMTGSNHSTMNKIQRIQEFEAYCKSNQLPFVVLDADNIPDELNQQIRTINPGVIAVPSFVDWHPEHRQVNLYLRNILRNMDKKPIIIWYQISVPIQGKYVNCTQEMSWYAHQEKWRMFVQYYPSQQNINTFRFQYIEKRFSEDGYACERFRVMNYQEWLECLQVLDGLETELNQLKAYLGDVGVLMSKSAEYYNILADKGALQL